MTDQIAAKQCETLTARTDDQRAMMLNWTFGQFTDLIAHRGPVTVV
ncbi:MAG: hypothetical protein AAGH43_06400 [Pseudomonadota bacterium]